METTTRPVSTYLYTASDSAVNARLALARWESTSDATLFVGKCGGYAVVQEDDVWMFVACKWAQTSPEELAGFLLADR